MSDPFLDTYKQAMRRLAATVAIVTAGRPEDCTGIAATAVTSVTADPPTLLVAVNRSASLSSILAREGRFCVNLLAERHRDLVGVFSGGKQGRDRFASGDWRIEDDAPPVLIDAVASLVCRTTATLDVSTHTIFVGQVATVVNHSRIDPLLWVDGRFAAVSGDRFPALAQ